MIFRFWRLSACPSFSAASLAPLGSILIIIITTVLFNHHYPHHNHQHLHHDCDDHLDDQVRPLSWSQSVKQHGNVSSSTAGCHHHHYKNHHHHHHCNQQHHHHHHNNHHQALGPVLGGLNLPASRRAQLIYEDPEVELIVKV